MTAPPRRVLLEARGVEKSLHGKKVLHGVSLSVAEGEIVGLLGPNGAGKTTLLKILAGVLPPDSGEVVVLGGRPDSPGTQRLVGYSPQDPGLAERLTGWENLYFYARLHGLSPREARERAMGYIEELGLTRDMDKLVARFSGGMKKKLGFIVSLLNKPRLLLLDEPTAGMDPGARRTVWGIIRREAGRGAGVLLATHYMDEAEKLCDRVYIIDEGRIIAVGSPDELIRRHAAPARIEVRLLRPVPPSVLEEHGLRVSTGNGVLIVYTGDPEKDVPVIVQAIHGAGGAVGELAVRKPSLEDVFLALTGRRLGEE